MPSAVSNFRKAELLNLPSSFSKSHIRESSLSNVGGYTDVFDIKVTTLTNSTLGMCCLLFEIKNNTKIFFDEVKVKFEVEGMEQLNN